VASIVAAILTGRGSLTSHVVKRAFLNVAARMRLLGPSYRAYERALAMRGSRGDRIAPDGLPLPPADLIVRVAGTADVAWFLEGGRLGYESVREHVALDGPAAVLDFGCGCGRVTRWWRDFDGTVAGSDLSAEAVDWCRDNLPFGRFERNGLEPPLVFADGSFDLVYGLSVFTHLAADTQVRWLDELHRVIRPDGRLLLTTHGTSYADRLTPDERARFDEGEIVVRWEQAAGSNLCAAYHPADALSRIAASAGFERVVHVEEGARGNPHQDLHVFRRV
jgi:SAM-dependent methyltransferase